MIETNYYPIYLKISRIFFIIKGQFPVIDYDFQYNDIVFHSTVHCIYVLS